MRLSWVCVIVSQNVTVCFEAYAMNFLCFGRAMDECLSSFGTGHSETVDSVDALSCLILLLDMAKRWLSDQSRPVLKYGVAPTLMAMSKQPSLLSQT